MEIWLYLSRDTEPGRAVFLFREKKNPCDKPLLTEQVRLINCDEADRRLETKGTSTYVKQYNYTLN